MNNNENAIEVAEIKDGLLKRMAKRTKIGQPRAMLFLDLHNDLNKIMSALIEETYVSARSLERLLFLSRSVHFAIQYQGALLGAPTNEANDESLGCALHEAIRLATELRWQVDEVNQRNLAREIARVKEEENKR